MSLLDELRSDQPRGGRGCEVCAFVTNRPDRAEWAEAFADRTIASATIYRALKARGFRFNDGAVGNHRRAGHVIPA